MTLIGELNEHQAHAVGEILHGANVPFRIGTFATGTLILTPLDGDDHSFLVYEEGRIEVMDPLGGIVGGAAAEAVVGS